MLSEPIRGLKQLFYRIWTLILTHTFRTTYFYATNVFSKGLYTPI